MKGINSVFFISDQQTGASMQKTSSAKGALESRSSGKPNKIVF